MQTDTKSALRWGAAAATFYLLVSLVSLAPTLAQPFDTVPVPITVRDSPFRGILAQDQKLSIATIAFNARTLWTAPTRLWDGPQCYPVHRAATLGEHMLGPGLRAALPALFIDNPVLLYNFVLLFDRWFAALAMYILVFALTRSVPAALVGGLLFGLHPFRSEDVAHPYVVANYWTPLALLFAYRLMRDARWTDALALAGFVSLQAIEGAYPLLALVVFGGTFGLYLLIANRSRLPALVPKLLLFAALSGSVAGGILYLYGRTGAEWDLTVTGFTALHRIEHFGPGGSRFPGFVMAGLAVLGALLRPRGLPRDPRPPFLLAGIVLLLWVLQPIPVPFLGIEIPSLFFVARRFVSVLATIRVPAACASGLSISAAVLASLGVHALTVGRARRSQVLWTVALVGAVLVELGQPRLATFSFGAPLVPIAERVAPPVEDLELYGKVADGALLDLPNAVHGSLLWLNMGDFILAGAYHRQLLGDCYNSHSVGVQDDLLEISARVPSDPAALEQLHALGFRNLIVHTDRSGTAPALLQPLPKPARLVARTATLMLYHIDSEQQVESSLDLLALEPAETLSQVELPAGGPQRLELPFRSHAAAAFRHPDWIVPSEVVVRWIDAGGSTALAEQLRILLPIALAPQGRSARVATVRAPEAPGTYRVELALAEDPARVLSRVAVRIGAAQVQGADAPAPGPHAVESAGRDG